jgi:hypothetical protein
MRRAARIAVTALALLGTGCISFQGEFGTRIPVENLGRIRDGETTRAEIIAWFGPPSALYNATILDVIFEDEDDLAAPAPTLDDVYTYRWLENDTTVFFVPIAFGVLDAAVTAETLTVFFDDEGRVEYHAYRKDQARPEDEADE